MTWLKTTSARTKVYLTPAAKGRLVYPTNHGRITGLSPRVSGKKFAASLIWRCEAQAAVENTTDEQEMQRGQIAVGILQQIRKRLLGRFNRVTSDHENSARAA